MILSHLFILTEEMFMQNEYGLGQEWCDVDNLMFLFVYFKANVAPRETIVVKVMLSLQDGVV